MKSEKYRKESGSEMPDSFFFLKKFPLAIISVFLAFFSLTADTKNQSPFLGYNLINLPTTKQLEPEVLEFRVLHRFGNAKNSLYDFGGLSAGANTQISLDYGITKRISLGISRTNLYRTYELKSKIMLLEQSESVPISISLYLAAGQETQKKSVSYSPIIPASSVPSSGIPALDQKIQSDYNTYTENVTWKQKSYLAGALFSRRFNDYFSLQLTPMFVHRNFTKSGLGNDRVGLGIGGRIRITKRINLTFEGIGLPKRDYKPDDYSDADRLTVYNTKQPSSEEINSRFQSSPSSFSADAAGFYFSNVIADKPVERNFTPASLGMDLETSGHVFSIFISNNRTLAQTQLLRGADYDWNKRDFNIGFNISRLFWSDEGAE